MKTVENTLNTLGTIFIVIGLIGGFSWMIISIIEENFFWFLIGLCCIFSGYVSGFLLKGISNIIDLLLILNSNIKKNSNYVPSHERNLSYKSIGNNSEETDLNESVLPNNPKKSFIKTIEETPSSHINPNKNIEKNAINIKNKSWAEISDSMKDK